MRTAKKGLEYFPMGTIKQEKITEYNFPKWNPSRRTLRTINEPHRWSYIKDFAKIKYRVLRNSSSAFVSKPEVRNYIFNRDGNKCVQFTSTDSLQIDHIISIANFMDGYISHQSINAEWNLQTLCLRCNAAKRHLTPGIDPIIKF